MSQNVVYDPTKASQNRTARVDARVMTDAELKVIFIPTVGAISPKAPAGRAIVWTPACTYEITIFRNGDQFGMSASRDYLSASIPLDMQSTILERCEAQDRAASEVVVTNIIYNHFQQPRGAQRGFMQVELQNQGKIWSQKFGVSTRNGRAYIMESEIYKKPADQAAIDAATKVAEDGLVLNGRYRVNVTEGVVTMTKSDVRTGGVHLSPELHDLMLNEATKELVRLGQLPSTTPIVATQTVVNAETGLLDEVMAV